MTSSQFEILLQKFKAHTLQPIEYEEFMEGIKHGQFDDILSEDILKAIYSHKPVGKLGVDQAANVLELIKRNISGSSVKKIPLFRRTWYRAVAAAAVIILIGTTTYFIQQRPVNAPDKATADSNTDIGPGGNKAILTLGNGSKIILDSTHNGILAQQGNTKIIKTDSSRLTYSALNEKSSEISLNTLSTPRGGVFQVTLPDGTEAWLNAESSITYPTRFDKKIRNVSITGEVYFEVAKDAFHPFVVNAAEGTRVEVLGTHFDVNTYSDFDEGQVRTTLLEGSVKIFINARNQIIKPGEMGIARYSGKDIQILDSVDINKVMGWQRGKMAMGLVGVQQVMREISRWYNVDIEFQSKIPEAKFYIYLNRNVPLSSVLHVLDVYGIKTKLSDKRLIVL